MGYVCQRVGPHATLATYVTHGFDEQLFDTGEVQLNYVTAGDATKPAILLTPARPNPGGDMKPRCRCSPSTSRRMRSTCAAKGAPPARRAGTRSTTSATTSFASSTAWC